MINSRAFISVLFYYIIITQLYSIYREYIVNISDKHFFGSTGSRKYTEMIYMKRYNY